jgi:hypothetical protein
MKTIIDYLNDLKEKTGSDYKTAKLLKTSKTNISAIRKRGQCGDETAVKMADLLGVSHEDLLIAAAIARSNDVVKAAWENISKKAGMAAAIMLAVGLNGYSPDAKSNSKELTDIYIMRSLRLSIIGHAGTA